MVEILETKQKILFAAQKIFSEKGYLGATTRFIAKEAEVNEVTIFRIFKNKKKLFLAVIENYSPVSFLDNMIKEKLSDDINKDLNFLAKRIFDSMKMQRKGILMSICESERVTEIKPMIAKSPFEQIKILALFFKDQIEKGKIRKINPFITAQSLIEMLFGLSIGLPLLEETNNAFETGDNIIKQFVDIFLNGIIKNKGK